MFVIDFDDTLFDTHALKAVLVNKSPNDLQEAELKDLLFSDAPAFLHYLSTAKQKLILLSFGELSFQNKKINATGIAKFFDEIIITPDSKELALGKVLEKFESEKDVWFVNDKIEETKKIVRHFPLVSPVLKMSPQFSEEDYKKSLIPYFSTLTLIQQYVQQQLK